MFALPFALAAVLVPSPSHAVPTGSMLPVDAPLQAADTATATRDPEIIRTDEFSMTLAARMQLQYRFSDPNIGPSNSSFGVRRGRIALSGEAYERFDYTLQLELTGGSVNLIDANVRFRPLPWATVWLGQGKAHFGRQQLVSSRDMNFVDRTLVDGRFAWARQVGAALLLENEGETLEGSVGVYNGHGINTPNLDGNHLSVARVVWTPLGALPPVEGGPAGPDSPRIALGGAVSNTTQGPGPTRTRITRFAVESQYRVRGFSAMAEFHRERASPANVAQATWTSGWYAQPGFLLPDGRHEIVARYGVISPSGTGADVTETGIALNRYLSGHRAKVQGDVRWIEREAIPATDFEARVQLQLTF